MPFKFLKDKLKYDTKYGSSRREKRRRACRNAARKLLEKEGRVAKGDGKDVHHKDRNAENNKKSNLAVLTEEENRGMNKA